MSLQRDTVQGASTALVTVGSRIALTALLARALGPPAYGELMFAQWVMELLVLVLGLGVPAALTRFLPGLQGRSDVEALRLRRSLLLGTALAMLLCLLCFTGWLAFGHAAGAHTPDAQWERVALLCLCTCHVAVCFVTPLLQGLLRFDAVLCGSLAGAVSAPLLVHVLVRPGNVADAALALAVSLALNAGCALLWLRRQHDVPAAQASAGDSGLRGMASYAANSWAAGLVAGMVWMRGELGVLKWQASSAAVAFYAGALTMAGAVTQVASLVTSALLPHLVAARQQEDGEKVLEMLRTTTQAALLLTTLCAFVLLTCSEALVTLLLGSGFGEAAPIVELLAIASVAISSGSAATLLQVETNGRFGLQSNAIALAVLITLSLALVPVFGVLGAAAARCAAQVCVAELVYRRLGTLDGFAPVARRLARAQRLAIAMLLVCWIADASWGHDVRVALGVGLPCLLIALTLVRAIVGVPMLRMLRMDARHA